jgi:E3 ubiquitin-protein ligase HECTD1
VGFVFESNRGTKHSFTAETSLGPEFAVGWGGKRSRKLRSKSDAAKSKVCAFKSKIILCCSFVTYYAEDIDILIKVPVLCWGAFYQCQKSLNAFKSHQA